MRLLQKGKTILLRGSQDVTTVGYNSLLENKHEITTGGKTILLRGYKRLLPEAARGY